MYASRATTLSLSLSLSRRNWRASGGRINCSIMHHHCVIKFHSNALFLALKALDIGLNTLTRSGCFWPLFKKEEGSKHCKMGARDAAAKFRVTISPRFVYTPPRALPRYWKPQKAIVLTLWRAMHGMKTRRRRRRRRKSEREREREKN
jgi:hypothetical protein